MEDFQGKYNGKQIDQLLDKANDIDLTKYALKTDNAPTATKLQAARTIALSGAVTGSVSSDFGSNVTISTTLANFDASKIASGTISIDRLPKAALERLIVVADDTARFALTTATAQSGDTVKVTSTGKMYLIKDESKLSSEDGYEPYTASQASSVPWSGVTGKPSTFTPPTSSASYNKVTYFDLDDICKLCFDSYDLHDVADTKVMSEFLHREGGRYWTTIDGVRQLYRRIECKMCFEVIEKLKKL